MALLDDKGLTYFFGKLKGMFAPKSHTHDDRYYTESEIDGKLKEEIDKQQKQIDAILREDLRKEGFVGHCYNGFTHCQPT